jgi:predicted nuclease of predicted toxin-antitoxin system
MKLLLDAHLPASLAQYFPRHDVLHTSLLPEGNLTSDRTINEISILEDRVLITKDSEFY